MRLIVLAAVGGALLAFFNSTYDRGLAEKRAAIVVAKAPHINETNAQVMCEIYVKRELKTPAKAEFASRRDLEITGSGNGPWTVIGYVDSQNSFGAMLRSNYKCTVSFNGEMATLQELKIL